MTGLCIEFQQRRVHIFSETVSTFDAAHLVQIADEEAFEALNFLLVTLC